MPNLYSCAVATLMSIILPAQAAERPLCSTAALTHNCDLFRPYQDDRFITIKNGERIPNPLFADQMNTAESKLTPAELQKQTVQRLDLEADLLAAWRTVPDKLRPHDDFQVGFARSLQTNALDSWIKGQATAAGAKIALPWPPQGDRTKPQLLAASEAVDYLNKLPPASAEKIRSLAAKIRKLSRTLPVVDTNADQRETRAAMYEEKLAFVKNAILDELTRGRPFEQLSPEEQSQYEKVRTVELAPLGAGESKPDCQTHLANASYEAGSHWLEICPSMKNATEAGIVATFAHEVGHSIDPCFMHTILFRFNTETLRARAKTSGAMTSEDKMIAEISRSGIRFTNSEIPVPDHLAEVVKGEKDGYLDILSKGVTFGKNPQAPTYTCLQSSGKFRTLDPRLIPAVSQRFAEEQALKRKLEPARATRLARTTAEKLRAAPDCNLTLSNSSQMQEVMADAWGAKVLGRWLASHPVNTDLEKVGVFSILLHGVCNGGEAAARRPGQPLRSHPPSRARIDTIYLSEPRIQAALGCRADPNKTCLAHFGTQGPIKDAPAAAAVPTGGEKPVNR